MSKRATDDLLASAIAGGASVEAAAQAAGVSRSTAFRRLTEAAFKGRVSELRSRMVDATVGRLAAMGGKAADMLEAAISGDPSPLAVRAALGLFDALTRLRTHAELEQRLAILEQTIARSNRERRSA